MNRTEILINQIWESNIKNESWKVLSTSTNKVELFNTEDVWNLKLIKKEDLRNSFTLVN